MKGAGFNTAARALATAPELDDHEESFRDVHARVEAALNTVMAAQEVPSARAALDATLAAKEALRAARTEQPSSQELVALVTAIHKVAA